MYEACKLIDHWGFQHRTLLTGVKAHFGLGSYFRPDGRQLAPFMPYEALSQLTKEDVAAIIAYLRSIPPVNNQVAGPFKPDEKVSIFTFRILPPGEMAAQAPK